jgi:hypothetical protein
MWATVMLSDQHLGSDQKAGTGTFALKMDKRSCAVGEALDRRREPFLQLAAVREVGPQHAPARRHAEYERIDRGGSGVGFLVGQPAAYADDLRRAVRLGARSERAASPERG